MIHLQELLLGGRVRVVTCFLSPYISQTSCKFGGIITLSCECLQVEAELLPEGKDNPWGNAFVKKETDLVNESTSGRLVDPMKSRFWKIRNPAVRHEYSGAPS